MGPKIATERPPKFPISDLHDDILENVLSELPGPFLIHVVQLVCKKWKQIIDSPSIWKIKTLRETPDAYFLTGGVPDDIRKFYFKNPLKRNLVKNPYALSGYNDWVKDGYCDFSIEPCYPDKAVGANRLEIPGWHGGPMKAWAASYMWCVLTQMIDLMKEGCSELLMDEIRPEIDISEWYAGRFDCGCTFVLEVALLAEDKTTVIDEFSGEWSVQQWEGKEWHQVTHTFAGYKPGVRYIKYTHKGKDTQFWAGNYGPKFTGATVKFNFRK